MQPLKVCLINMPFTIMEIPSIALTQIRSVVQQRLGERVKVRILYLNQDFIHYLGDELYEALFSDTTQTGLGDWFFRQAAFPEQPDNTQQYFRRYHNHLNEKLASLKGRILAKRLGLERFLTQLIDKYHIGREDVAGFTSMFSQNVPSFALARLLKSRKASIVTAMGGANCEAPMGIEIARSIEAIDFAFSGPGLVSFPRFLGHLLDGEAEKCHRIKGVFSARNCDEDFLKGAGSMGEELPIQEPVRLDYDSYLADLDRNFPKEQINPGLPFETSRGCWWGQRAHCTFCGLNGGNMGFRAMPSAMALHHIQDLIDRYGHRCTHFESVDNIMPKEYFSEVFPHLKVPAGTTFFYEVKVDMREEDMEALGKAGVIKLQPGIESLNSSTLRLMKKGTTAFRNIVFLKNSLLYGIYPSWNLLIGFPRESHEVYSKYLADIPLLHHLPPPIGAFPVRFDRFSPYHANADEYGLDLSPYDYYSFIYPLGKAALHNLAYHFEDRNYDSEYLVGMVSWKDKLNEAIQQWRKNWYVRDGKLQNRAQLFIKEQHGKTVVHDSRSGVILEHDVGGTGIEMLRLMDSRGWKIPDVAQQMDLSLEDASRRMAGLRRRNLLFEENQRFVSLVMRHGQLRDHPVGAKGMAMAHLRLDMLEGDAL